MNILDAHDLNKKQQLTALVVIFGFIINVVMKPYLFTNLLLFVYGERGDVIGKKGEMFTKVRSLYGLKVSYFIDKD